MATLEALNLDRQPLGAVYQQILKKYGVDYCDRTVSMSEAAKRAVEKIGR